MAQFTIFGYEEALDPVLDEFSDLLHGVAVEVFELPAEKRFHRFVTLDHRHFRAPADRSERYTIVELLMFEGRTVETKKLFYARLYEEAKTRLGIEPIDLEITIIETPRHDWGIRGLPGDELGLNYRVEV